MKSQQIVTAAYLAVHHINTHNPIIVSNMTVLKKQFRLGILMYDTKSTIKGGLDAMVHCLQKKYAVMIGPGRSSVASPISFYHDIQQIPMISYGVTASSFAIDTGYFMRTIPSDSVSVKAIVDFAIDSGWKHIAIVYTDGIYGINYLHSLTFECEKKNIILDYQHAFLEQEERSIENAVRKISQEETRIVVLLIFQSDVEFFFSKSLKPI